MKWYRGWGTILITAAGISIVVAVFVNLWVFHNA